MLTDVHCHPFDLAKVFPEMEREREKLGVLAAASACDLEEFEYCEKLEGILPCFAIHPQMGKGDVSLLDKLASEKRIAAIGECGFDLYNDEYKATEKWQDEIFASHLEIALKNDLPIILHVRRAMHKIFAYADKLKKCKTVVFHSWQGTLEEGNALLRRGVNVYFSFGNNILNNHKKAIRCCSLFPSDRLLTETDAPYQPPRGADFSSWKDLPKIVEVIASLRNVSSKDMETQIEANFNSSLRPLSCP